MEKFLIHVTIIRGNKVERHYFNKNSSFSVFLLIDSNKSIVMNKRFENSLFTKLVIEKRNLTNFKTVYKNNNTIILKNR